MYVCMHACMHACMYACAMRSIAITILSVISLECSVRKVLSAAVAGNVAAQLSGRRDCCALLRAVDSNLRIWVHGDVRGPPKSVTHHQHHPC